MRKKDEKIEKYRSQVEKLEEENKLIKENERVLEEKVRCSFVSSFVCLIVYIKFCSMAMKVVP